MKKFVQLSTLFLFAISFFLALGSAIVFLSPASASSALTSSAASSVATFDTTITSDVVGNGTVLIDPDMAQYEYGQTITLTAVPAQGWKVAHWSGDLERTQPWWHPYWPYRLKLSVKANGVQREGMLAEVTVDFTQLFDQLGESGTFEEESIRVVEIDLDGAVLDANVPFQFDQDAGYNSSTNAVGNLVILLSGTTPAESGRLYHVYFAPTGNPYTSPTFTSLITSTFSNIKDVGWQSYRFETVNATYFFHTAGGGFSSLDDLDGNDWIGYSNTTGSGGKFRGIPNLIFEGVNQTGSFHPGTSGGTTTRLNDGPLKASFQTTEGGWRALWEIYPEYVRMTLQEAAHDYWFLYEGTPGGALDERDFSVRSDGSVHAYNANWTEDISGEEWIYFADPAIGDKGRALFFVHHEQDSVVDSYRRMNDGNGTMTVFGFGRDGINTELSETPQQFTFGLIDETSYANAKPLIDASYKDLDISVMAAESLSTASSYTPGSATTFTMTMNMNRAITATFVPIHYAVEEVVTGNGVVNLSSPIETEGYLYGEPISLTAIADLGWNFVEWSGLVTGNTNPTTNTITADSIITATFEPISYTLTLIPPASGGTITKTPDASTYRYGDEVELTALADSGYRFVQWQGELATSNPIQTVTITQDVTITAEFEQALYTLDVIVVGNGDIVSSSEQVTYTHGDTVTLTAIPEAGWRFEEWQGPITGTNPMGSFQIEQNETVTATFLPELYTILTETIGSGLITINPETETHLYNTQVTLTATPAEHWQFVEWQGDVTGTMPSATTIITKNSTITATFTPIFYTLNPVTVGDGTIQLTPPTDPAGYVFNEPITITAVPADNWRFVEWVIDGQDNTETNTTSVLSITVDGPMTITARFEAMTTAFKVEVQGKGEVHVEPNLAEFKAGQLITITAKAEPGWRFVEWSDPALGPESSISLNYSPDQTVVATFVQEQYTVKLYVDGGGTATWSPEASTYTYGQVIELTASPSPHWRFAGWQGGISSTVSSLPFTVTASTIITATFSPIPYSLNTTVQGNGRIEVSRNGQIVEGVSLIEFRSGDIVTIKAVPDSGWHFVEWSDDLSGNDAVNSLAIDGDKSIVATFEKNGESEGLPNHLFLPLISSTE
ncbi:MAG: hypothetical protein AAF702_34150 [Chloroflexota bacterium]